MTLMTSIKLIQLLVICSKRLLIASRDDNHAGQPNFFGLPHSDALNIEAAASEQTGYPLQNARLIIHEYGNRMFG